MWIWCTIAEQTWAIRASVQENLQMSNVWKSLVGCWILSNQGWGKTSLLQTLNRCNFQKLQLKLQLMTEFCAFWLDFLIPNNGFVLQLCTSSLGRKNPNKQWKNKSSCKASNILSSSTMHWLIPPTPHCLWFGFTTLSRVLMHYGFISEGGQWGVNPKLNSNVISTRLKQGEHTSVCTGELPTQGTLSFTPQEKRAKCHALFSAAGTKENTLCIPASSLIHVWGEGEGTQGLDALKSPWPLLLLTSFPSSFTCRSDSLHSFHLPEVPRQQTQRQLGEGIPPVQFTASDLFQKPFK